MISMNKIYFFKNNLLLKYAVQWTKALVTKPHNPSSKSRSPMLEDENQLLPSTLWSLCTHVHMM